MLQIYLFGVFRLVSDGAAQAFRGLPKTLPLFAYLLLHRRQAIKRQRLSFTFWPDDCEDAARSNLRRHLHDLRRALPAPPPATPWLLAEADAVQWNPAAPYWLDVAEFERLSVSPETMAAAVPLYTGDLLPELYDDWIFFERERLQERFFTILERLTAAREAEGDFAAAIGYAGQILRRDPLREETSRRLMALHYRAGDRSAAIREYRRIECDLRSELDLPPMPETTALYESIARGEVLPGASAQRGKDERAWSPPHNLPAQVATFVGRQEELSAMSALLGPVDDRSRCRLLTLTGAGGSGKTRLSLEVAARVLKAAPKRFADGAWFVSLSLIGDASLVIPAIADALSVTETARGSLLSDIKNHLREKRLLLLFDNFEHVMPAAGVVGELLAAAPGVSAIVTSRAPLRLYGEHEYPLAPLSTPDPASLPHPEDLARSPAVALFVDRARAADPGFRLTSENAAAVVEICVRLDGLPLAIELAAARARIFGPAAMLGKLQSRLPFLAARARDLPARQTTLRAAIDWSYNLLAEADRQLFARLSVFVGGFSAADAKQVAGAEADADMIDLLLALVDQSMLRILPASEAGAEPRFRMLTLLREYAGERLVSQGEWDEVHRRHAGHFLALAQEGEHELRGPDQLRWLRRLDAEQDNLRAVLAWSSERGATGAAPDAQVGLALAAALGWFWYVRGHWSEGSDWLGRLLATADGPPLARARAMKSRALLLSGLNRFDEAIPLFHHSLALFASHHDPISQGDALNWLGRAEFRQKRYDTAEAHSAEAVTLLQAAGDRFGEAMALRNVGDVLRLIGRYEEAQDYFKRALAVGRAIGGGWALGMILNSIGELSRLLGRYTRAAETYDEEIGLQRILGNRIQLATALHNQGHTMLHLGDAERAAILFREGLSLHKDTNNRRGMCLCLAGLAGVAAQTGRAGQAARLLAAVSVHLTPMGAHLMGPADQAEYDWHLATVRAALDPAAFEAAWEIGSGLAFEQAIAGGLEV